MRLLFDDVSPTAIISSLHDHWPSVGILSDEAGKLFNSRTFENIGLFNKLWDGDPVSLDRHRTSASYTVAGARLTVSLMSQQQTFRDFLEKQGSLARDNGFLARCLTCWPVSTQGFRYIQPDQITLPNQAKPSLEEFQKIIESLLNKAWQRHQLGSDRMTIKMSDEAARCWSYYYNRIESAIGPNNWWTDIKDGAAKAAENIARLACLFQAFESCESQDDFQISAEMIHAADVICMWYMNHFKGIFGQQSALSAEVQDANELMAWLEKTWAQRNANFIAKNEVRQLGPNKIRSKDRLERAMDILQKDGKIIVAPLNAVIPGRKIIYCIWRNINQSSRGY